MRLQVQYVSDAKGKPKAVQVPFRQWESIMKKLAQYEIANQFKNDLQEALEDVKRMQNGAKPKRTIQEMLDEL